MNDDATLLLFSHCCLVSFSSHFIDLPNRETIPLHPKVVPLPLRNISCTDEEMRFDSKKTKRINEFEQKKTKQKWTKQSMSIERLRHSVTHVCFSLVTYPVCVMCSPYLVKCVTEFVVVFLAVFDWEWETNTIVPYTSAKVSDASWWPFFPFSAKRKKRWKEIPPLPKKSRLLINCKNMCNQESYFFFSLHSVKTLFLFIILFSRDVVEGYIYSDNNIMLFFFI